MSIRYLGTRQELAADFARLVRVLAGKERDPSGAVEALMLRMGTVIQGKIKDNFVVQSEGGSGELGTGPWAPLSPVTLALRRKVTGKKTIGKLQSRFKTLKSARASQVMSQAQRLLKVIQGTDRKSRRRALGILAVKQKRGLITPTQYRQIRRLLSGKMTQRQMQEAAFAGGFALILRDTGILLNSISPGVASSDSVLRLEPGVIIVGSNLKRATYHNSARPRKQKKSGGDRLPRRQFLPDDVRKMPAAWYAAVAGAMQRGIHEKAFWQQFLGNKAA